MSNTNCTKNGRWTYICSWRVLIPAQSLAPFVLQLNEKTINIRVVYKFVQHNKLNPLYCTFPQFFFRKRRYSWNIICVIGWQTEIVVRFFLNQNCPFHVYLFLVCLPYILIRVSTHFCHSISRKQTPYVLDYDIIKNIFFYVWWKSTLSK